MADSANELNEKVLSLERKMGYRRGLWHGLFLGIGIAVLGLVAGAAILYTQREAMAKWTFNTFAVGYMEDLFAGFPDAYMSYNRDRVLEALDNFTNAVAAKKVSREDFRRVGALVFSVIKDKRITYQEMEKILKTLNRVSHVEEGTKK